MAALDLGYVSDQRLFAPAVAVRAGIRQVLRIPLAVHVQAACKPVLLFLHSRVACASSMRAERIARGGNEASLTVRGHRLCIFARRRLLVFSSSGKRGICGACENSVIRVCAVMRLGRSGGVRAACCLFVDDDGRVPSRELAMFYEGMQRGYVSPRAWHVRSSSGRRERDAVALLHGAGRLSVYEKCSEITRLLLGAGGNDGFPAELGFCAQSYKYTLVCTFLIETRARTQSVELVEGILVV